LIAVSMRPHWFVVRYRAPEGTDLREKSNCVGFRNFEVRRLARKAKLLLWA
jgi:hypothetical protein